MMDIVAGMSKTKARERINQLITNVDATTAYVAAAKVREVAEGAPPTPGDYTAAVASLSADLRGKATRTPTDRDRMIGSVVYWLSALDDDALLNAQQAIIDAVFALEHPAAPGDIKAIVEASRRTDENETILFFPGF